MRREVVFQHQHLPGNFGVTAFIRVHVVPGRPSGKEDGRGTGLRRALVLTTGELIIFFISKNFNCHQNLQILEVFCITYSQELPI